MILSKYYILILIFIGGVFFFSVVSGSVLLIPGFIHVVSILLCIAGIRYILINDTSQYMGVSRSVLVSTMSVFLLGIVALFEQAYAGELIVVFAALLIYIRGLDERIAGLLGCISLIYVLSNIHQGDMIATELWSIYCFYFLVSYVVLAMRK